MVDMSNVTVQMVRPKTLQDASDIAPILLRWSPEACILADTYAGRLDLPAVYAGLFGIDSGHDYKLMPILC
jgi:hypothetical protein